MSPQTFAVGWDLHRKFSQLSVRCRSESGEIRVVERKRLEHADQEAMRGWLREHLPGGTPVAMEGAFGWPWVADLLTELAFDPHLGHPPAIKVLAKNEAKADRRDADRLGRFWLQGIFPESYLATPEVRQIRERLRYRTALVAMRTAVKNRVQPYAALGLDRGGWDRAAFEELSGQLASVASPSDLWRPDQQGASQGGVARELCELVYIVWKKREPYREHPPARPGTRRNA